MPPLIYIYITLYIDLSVTPTGNHLLTERGIIYQLNQRDINTYNKIKDVNISVPARLGKGQGAKEIGHNLARERPKSGTV